MFPLLKLFFKSVIKLPIVILFSPIHYQYKAKNHTSQVCKVGNAIGRSTQAQKYLQSSISHHKIFSLDRKWDREYKHLTIGEQHTECQQNAIYRSRSANCSHQIQVLRHRDHGNPRIHTVILR